MISLLIPPGVTVTGDRGVYLVTSRSRQNHPPHRVCVEMMLCECEAAQKCKYAKLQKRDGKAWDTICPHLKVALAAHGVVCSLAFKGKEQEP